MTSWPERGNAVDAVKLLQRESLWNLGGYDGCLCTSLGVMNFEIAVSCRKSTGNGKTNIIVSCSSLGTDVYDCRLVAEEVARQVIEQEPEVEIEIKEGVR